MFCLHQLLIRQPAVVSLRRSLLVFLAFLSAGPLYSQTFTAEAQGFSVFVKESFTFGGGNIDGAVAIGHNLTIKNNQGQFSMQEAGAYTAPGMSGGLGLLVGNKVNLNGGGVNILSGAKIQIGNSSGTQALSTDQNGASVNTRVVSASGGYNSTPNLSLNHQQSAAVYQPSSIDFAAAFATFEARSTNVGALATNVVITNANGVAQNPASISNNSQIYIQSLLPGANILNLTGANLNKINSITFNAQPSAGAYLIINVDKPGTFNWENFNFAGVSSSHAPYILVNFQNSTTVKIKGASAVYATVFAPFASIKKNTAANIGGQVIARQFTMTQGGGIQTFYFLSDDPSSTAFPVELTTFDARWVGETASLMWETSSEANSSHFEIERSTDATTFLAIDQVKAAGFSNELIRYTLDDQEASSLFGSAVYYRLKQYDLDGKISFSRTIRLALTPPAEFTFRVYPNPGTEFLTIGWDQDHPVQQIILTDVTGTQVLALDPDPGLALAQLDARNLPEGIYHLTIKHQRGTTTQSVILR